MASTDFRTVNVSLSKTGSNLTGTGQATFNSQVINAGGAIQSFELNYESSHDHHVQTLGASITDVTTSGTNVNFNVALKLSDRDNHTINSGSINALISAYCQ